MAKKKNKKSEQPIQELDFIEEKVPQEVSQALQTAGNLLAQFDDEPVVEAKEEFNEEELSFSEADADTDADAESTEEEIASEDGDEVAEDAVEFEGTELDNFDSAEIEDIQDVDDDTVIAIVESVLFSTDRPVGLGLIKQAFRGTNVNTAKIKQALKDLTEEYQSPRRGFTLEEVGGGWQLRTKPSTMDYLRRSVKAKAFKLSGPALEVMSIVAYKQPITKAQVDEIRGVESGHLMRALMEKNLVTFGERSELPGKPMFYETTRKFLEIFGLRNVQELPSLEEIDQLIPEGMGDDVEKETLSDITATMSEETGTSYSQGEDELLKISSELDEISTSSEFFEKEKQRMKDQQNLERAQNIREALTVGETVEPKELRWLERYEAEMKEREAAANEVEFVVSAAEEVAVIAESEDESNFQDESNSSEPEPEPSAEL